MAAETKICSKCGEEKPVSDFGSRGNRCKPCTALYLQQYREKNKEVIAEYKRQYRQKNKNRIAEYRQEHKKRDREYKRRYYEENKARITVCRKDNKEKIAEYMRRYNQLPKNKIMRARYRQNNKERIVEYMRRYNQKNKENIRNWSRRRVKELRDHYVRDLIKERFNINTIPREFIEVYKMKLKTQRLLTQKLSENDNKN